MDDTGEQQVRAYVPPGWPAAVRPPGAPDWDATAVAWLLDQCPPEYRSHDVLRRHPVVLARFTAWHVEGALKAARQGYAAIRAELRDLVPAETVTAAMAALDREGSRLASTARAVEVVEAALAGREFRPRL